jgi:hypothetical protein
MEETTRLFGGEMRKLLYFSRQLGIDPIKTINAVRGLSIYLSSILKFKLLPSSPRISLSPVLQDFTAQAGSADGHYFWQDLIVARWIFESNPNNHLDVGSRVDGFVAHLLSFREVTMVDIRPLEQEIPGLTVFLGDAQKPLTQINQSYDSVSSLHAIEHFGLGRYRDALEVNGHINGLRNISETVKTGGELFVSFPIGKESVEFNEQRILDPLLPEQLLGKFELQEFVLIPWKGSPTYGLQPKDVNQHISGQAGLYRFKRIK